MAVREARNSARARVRSLMWTLVLFGVAGHWLGRAAAADAGAETARARDAGTRDAGTRDAGHGTAATSGSGDAKESREGDEKKADFQPAPPLPKLDDDGGANLRVYVIPIEGTIDLGLAPFVRRVLDEATGAAAVILDVDTFGGRVDAAVKIRDALLAAKIPTIAFINRRAISAGALISFACEHIVVTSGASMGAATPIQLQGGTAQPVAEKMVSYMRSEMRATAEARGRPGDIAEAMVDADIEIPGISPKGKLLTVTTKTSLEVGVANAKLETLPELLDALGLGSALVIEPSTNWAERLARIFTDPIFSGLLMSLGMLGLLIELYSPGFGVPGALGVTCLVLFFAGHMVVELAGWEELLLFVVGLSALAAEVFVIPGFGITGVVGIGLIVASLALSLVGVPIDISWDAGLLTSALSTVMLSLAGTAIALGVVVKFLPRNSFGRWLVLETTLSSGRGAQVEDDRGEGPAATDWNRMHGKTGVAITDLRPSGKARFDGEIIDVVSEYDYIEAGTRVAVSAVEGFRITVVRDDGGGT